MRHAGRRRAPKYRLSMIVVIGQTTLVPFRLSTPGHRWSFVQLLGIAVAAALLADLSFHLRPTNYFGGSSDEQRYLEAALAWIAHGPAPGTTHWSLRHPLILSIVAAFRTFGISLWSLQLVPRLYGDLLFAVTVPMLTRHAGWRVALTWLVLALAMPVLHVNATNCGPEIPELAFGAISLWCLFEARNGGRRAPVLTIASGLSFALAVMTRETALCLLPVYGWAWWRRRMSPALAVAFVLAFLLPILLDNGWLWWRTGQPFYRITVDQSHTQIYSAHLIGGTYRGRVILNPDLASRWLPIGPVKLWWATDPILNFFASPDLALVFVAWAVLTAVPSARPPGRSRSAIAQPWLLAIAVLCYVLVTWVLTLRPQPRYYLFAIYAATIAVALLLQPRPGRRQLSWLQRGLLFCQLFCGVLVILLSPNRQRDADLILPWLGRHPRAVLHMGPEDVARIAFPATLQARRANFTAAAPAVGQLRARILDDRHGPGPLRWRQVDLLTGPHLFPYINPPRQIVIEQRIG